MGWLFKGRDGAASGVILEAEEKESGRLRALMLVLVLVLVLLAKQSGSDARAG